MQELAQKQTNKPDGFITTGSSSSGWTIFIGLPSAAGATLAVIVAQVKKPAAQLFPSSSLTPSPAHDQTPPSTPPLAHPAPPSCPAVTPAATVVDTVTSVTAFRSLSTPPSTQTAMAPSTPLTCVTDAHTGTNRVHAASAPPWTLPAALPVTPPPLPSTSDQAASQDTLAAATSAPGISSSSYTHIDFISDSDNVHDSQPSNTSCSSALQSKHHPAAQFTHHSVAAASNTSPALMAQLPPSPPPSPPAVANRLISLQHPAHLLCLQHDWQQLATHCNTLAVDMQIVARVCPACALSLCPVHMQCTAKPPVLMRTCSAINREP